MVGSGAAVVAAVMLARVAGTEFLPQLNGGVIWIRANLAHIMRSQILESPEVKMDRSPTGRNNLGMDPAGPNRNAILIGLHPYNTWEPGKTNADVVEDLSRKQRAEVPRRTFNFTQPSIETSREIATGSPADLAVIIIGPGLEKRRQLAREALGVVRTIRGAADRSIDEEADQPLGMIPAVTATGTGSHIQRPLATVIVGWLLSMLVLTLLLLPSL